MKKINQYLFTSNSIFLNITFLLIFNNTLFSQTNDYVFVRNNNIVFKDSLNIPYKFPLTGGFSNCQFSSIDLNLDGYKDLVVFDKIGNRISCFINSHITDSISYIYAPEYNIFFPPIYSWMQLIDYNNDSKEDIFTYSNGGIKVYKNISNTNLKFTLVKKPILSSYNGILTNLFCLSEDYPAISDIDGDGDKDILNFWVLGRFINYHKNLSIEKYGNSDSLDFELADESWGCFAEDEGSNVVILDTCLNKGMKSLFTFKENIKHSGSTLLAEDFNGDGLKDLIIGDVDYPNLIKLTNNGSIIKAKIISQDTNFPLTNHPVNLYSFPVANYLDVNNDGKKDLLVSSFEPSLTTAESFESNWLYLNNGTNSQAAFSFKQNDFIQNQTIDFGTGSYPVLFDIDNDGLKDLFIGNIGYLDTSYLQNGFLHSEFISKIAYFKNEGSINNPVFKLITRDFANISVLKLQAVFPTFGDINNDGKAELIIGNADGKLFLFVNNSSITTPNFVLSQSNYQNIDIGEFSSPQLFDLNKDGLYDLIIGERQNFWKDASNNIITRKGNLNYYNNTGSSTNPLFTLITDSLGGVDITNYTVSNYGFSTPCFFLTPNNETRLFVGNEEGKIYYFKNIDNNLNGKFNIADTLFSIQGSSKYQIIEGIKTAITVSDINNDNFLDIFIGNASGGISFYKGSHSNTGIYTEEEKTSFDFEIFPNPCKDYFNIRILNFDIKYNYSIEIYSTFGEILLSKELINKQTDIVNFAKFKQGVYICKIQILNENSVLKEKTYKKLIIKY